jgi:hypothetical protein
MNNNKEELFKNAIDGLDIMKITYISFTLPKNLNKNFKYDKPIEIKNVPNITIHK